MLDAFLQRLVPDSFVNQILLFALIPFAAVALGAGLYRLSANNLAGYSS